MQVATSCLIMMATYNGEKYLRQQLDSIVNQSFTNWNLLIRDDGSKDKTMSILSEYQRKDSRIEVLSSNGSLHGPYHNFHELICEAKKRHVYEYYAFSDQDDIWDTEKIQKMISVAKRLEKPGVPAYYYHDLCVVDGQDNLIDQSVNSILGIDLSETKLNVFFAHAYIWGCTSMFNHALMEMVPAITADYPLRDIMSHDNYYAKFAITFGDIYYIDEPLIRYRKHGGNVTDTHKFKMNAGDKLRKLSKYQNICRTNARVYTQTLCMIDLAEKNKLNSDLLDEIKSVIESGGMKAVRYLKKHNIHRKQKIRDLGLYWVMLTCGYQNYIMK